MFEMKRPPSLLAATMAVVICVAAVVDSQSCPSTISSTFQAKETDPPGLNLVNLTYDPGLIWMLEVNNKPTSLVPSIPDLRSWILQSVIIKSESGQVNIVLNQTLDLEYVYERWSHKMFVLQFVVKCSAPQAALVAYDFFVTIQDVNEFPPKFIGDPFIIYVPENTSVNTVVVTLRNNATDDDVVSSNEGDISYFSMAVSPLNTGVDGSTLFALTQVQRGDVQIIAALDFESFPPGRSAHVVFDVTAWDNGRLNVTTNLTIHILDSDDLPPVFHYPGCTISPCVTAYSAEIGRAQTGVVTNIQPGLILARDGDTLGFAVRYAIINGPTNPPFRDYFHINNGTGEFSIIKSLGNFTGSDIVLVIEAKEISDKALTSQVAFIVRFAPDSTTTATTTANPTPTPPAKLSEDDGGNNTVVIIVIVLAVVVGVVLIALVVLVLLVRKFSKKSVYPKDGPDTDGEGSQDGLTKGDNFSVDSGKPNGLPPLTTSVRKWRRGVGLSNPRSDISEEGDDSTINDFTSSNSRYFGSGTISSRGLQSGSLCDTPHYINGYAQTGQPGEDSYVSFPVIHLPGVTPNKKRHRRSRKEKRLQQAQKIQDEEFDGTKSYPMDADPAFFTEVKKSKVKLSTRRKPTVTLDPKFWLTVDNDFMD